MTDLTPLGLPAHLRRLVTPGQVPDRATAEAMELDDAVSLGAFLGQVDDYGEALRLAVGAWLLARKAEVERGQWGDLAATLAEAMGRTPRALREWMKSAERQYLSKMEALPLSGAGGANREARGVLPAEQMSAVNQIDGGITVASARLTAINLKPAMRVRWVAWCEEFLANVPGRQVVDVAPVEARTRPSPPPANRTISNDVTLQVGAKEACKHPAKSRKRGQASGVMTCGECGKVNP